MKRRSIVLMLATTLLTGALSAGTAEAAGQNQERAAGVAGQAQAYVQSQATALDTIQERGVLRVGTTGDYKPLSYYNKDTNQYEGIEIDLANSLGQALGVQVEFVPTTWPTLMEDTLNGKFDVAMSGFTKTAARQRVAYLSDGYITFGKTALMRKSDAGKYTSLEAMNRPEVRVGVNPGGTNEKFVRQYLPNATVTVHDKNAEIPGLVADGTFDIMITDSLEAIRYSHENEVLGTPLLENLFTKNQFGVLMKRDEALLHFVNAWLAQQELEGNIDKVEQAHLK